VIACDNIVTLPKAMLAEDAVGHLGLEKRAALDQALRFALDVQY
jgi:mRNA-degrading endonuclease toxin of MazEF toxin-antitoxin module